MASLLAFGASLSATAADPAPGWARALDNDYYKISLNVRLRVELADLDGLDDSQAYTMRTRLGLGSKPLFGFSAFAEVENSFAFDDGTYFDVAETPTGQTAIADPEATEVNQAFLQYENEGLLGVKFKAGRQRVIFDDARFIGNVGWRQNEQTFDAALAQTSFGLEGLTLSYMWIEEAHRIFGNDGPGARRDFDSNSHVANLAYRFAPALHATVFAYLLDFDNSAINSSSSYGLRLTGKKKLSDDWTVAYAGSYAYQQDAGDHPVDYDAFYANVEGSLGYAPLGSIGVGYELLGSDQGNAVFATPLATAHKFNGFADVFLTNGGPNGLRDAYVEIAPELPLGFKGKLVYHHFWADEGGGSLGDELDFVVSKPLAKALVLLSKGAWFEGRVRGPADLWRWWLELNYGF